MLVRDLQDGADIDQILLVREVETRQKRDGGEFLKLVLADRSGSVPAMVWDGVAQLRELCVAGTPVRVLGRYAAHPRYGAQVTVRALRQAAPGSFDLADLLDGPPRSAPQMETDLRELVATVRNPHLRALLDRFFDAGTETWDQYRSAPAAKFFHQAYRHGLLEHSLSVAQAVGAISATFPGVDRDVAVTGALLHDIGKLEAYTADPTTSIDLTDDGRLQGEIPLGYFRVRREIEDLDGFPADLAQRRPAHHPQPPRLARARQPGGAVHARGDARAHDRQPRRPARVVRPPREGALPRTGVVGLRPCARRRRLVRPAGRTRRRRGAVGAGRLRAWGATVRDPGAGPATGEDQVDAVRTRRAARCARHRGSRAARARRRRCGPRTRRAARR